MKKPSANIPNIPKNPDSEPTPAAVAKSDQAAALMAELQSLGIRLYTAGDQLLASPASLLPARLHPLIRRHKAELKALVEVERQNAASDAWIRYLMATGATTRKPNDPSVKFVMGPPEKKTQRR